MFVASIATLIQLERLSNNQKDTQQLQIQLKELKSEPGIFVADLDSIHFVVDTGANATITNDVKHIGNFEFANGNFKGIGGSPALLKGTGTIRLNLTSNDKIPSKLSPAEVVYIPRNPYNLASSSGIIRISERQSFQS